MKALRLFLLALCLCAASLSLRAQSLVAAETVAGGDAEGDAEGDAVAELDAKPVAAIDAKLVAPALMSRADILRQAAEGSITSLSAQRNLEKAYLAYLATKPLGASSLNLQLSGAYNEAVAESSLGAGDEEELSGPSHKETLSLSLPILSNLSLSAGLSYSKTLSASGSISWNPLASGEAQSQARTNYLIAQAALAEAQKQAMQEAWSLMIAYAKANSEAEAAVAKVGRAELAYLAQESRKAQGQSGAEGLLTAELELAQSKLSLSNSKHDLELARENLCYFIGGDAAAQLRAGAGIDLGYSESDSGEDGEWRAPERLSLPPSSAKLEGQAALAAAKIPSMLKDKGPLSINASIDTKASFSLSGSFSLSLSQLDGRDARQTRLALASAQASLAVVERQALQAYNAALEAERRAEEAVSIARLKVQAAEIARKAAQIKLNASLISESDYGLARDAEKEARSSLGLARLELEKTRCTSAF